MRFVLDGTLQVQGEQPRVSPHLTDVTSGEILQSDRWAEHQNDLFGIQDRIIIHFGASIASTNSGVTQLSWAKANPLASLSAYEH